MTMSWSSLKLHRIWRANRVWQARGLAIVKKQKNFVLRYTIETFLKLHLGPF